MALLNVACILAGRGRRVLMIDFDLEAPGLTLFQQKLQKKSQPPPPPQPGLVEMVHDFLRSPAESPLADTDNVAAFREHYVRNLPIPKKLQRLEGGYLDLMPSGRLDETYRQRLYDIKFDRLYEEGIGQPLFKHLKKVIRDSELYDYVLVDSRTGMSDEGSICTRDLADHLVVLTGLNLQNIEGTVHVLRQLKGSDRGSGRVIFVASPVPVYYEELREKRMREARRAISKAGFKADLKLRIPYHPRLALDEEPFIYDWSGTDLFAAYETLQGEIRRTAKDRPQDWEQRINKAIENNQPEEALPLLRQLAVEVPSAANSILRWLSGTSMAESSKLKALAKPFFELWLNVAEDKAAVLRRFGEVLMDQGHFDHSLEEYNRALTIANEQGSDVDIVNVKHGIGNIAFSKGRLDQALSLYNEVLRGAEKIDLKFMAAVAHTSIGRVYFYRGEYETALKEWDIALSVYEELGATVNMAQIRTRIGNVYEQKGWYKEALSFHEQAYASLMAEGRKVLAAAVQGEIGNVKILLGDKEEGLKLIETCNQTFQASGDRITLAEGYVDYALGLLSTGNVEAAGRFLDEHWALIESNAAAIVRAEAYVVRAKIKAALNDAAGAAEDANTALTFYREQRIHNALAKEAEALASGVMVEQSNN